MSRSLSTILSRLPPRRAQHWRWAMTDRLAMIEDHLAALWPLSWRDASIPRQSQPFLVRSYPDPAQPRPNGKPSWLSSWHRMPSDVTSLAQRALAGSEACNEYYGVNLGRADCQPSMRSRLKNKDIVVVPGLL